MPRIGFACMYRHPQQSLSLKELERIERTFNPRSTTLRWMASAGREAAEAKLEEIVAHNLNAQRVLLEYVATLPPMLRMLRLSSDLLPFYSHAEIAPFYRRAEIQSRLEAGFAAIGELAAGIARQSTICPSHAPSTEDEMITLLVRRAGIAWEGVHLLTVMYMPHGTEELHAVTAWILGEPVGGAMDALVAHTRAAYR